VGDWRPGGARDVGEVAEVAITPSLTTISPSRVNRAASCSRPAYFRGVDEVEEVRDRAAFAANGCAP